MNCIDRNGVHLSAGDLVQREHVRILVTAVVSPHEFIGRQLGANNVAASSDVYGSPFRYTKMEGWGDMSVRDPYA